MDDSCVWGPQRHHPLGRMTPIPVSGYHFHRCVEDCKSHRRGRLRLAGKTLYSSNTLWPPPRTYQRDSKAKRATGSEKVTSWFSGWECAIRMMQGLAGCSAKLGHGKWGHFPTLNNSCSSHLGGLGEPSGATWRPRGRPWRPPECPDVHGRLRRQSPAWEKG